jgi:two-component system LytT family response regulator
MRVRALIADDEPKARGFLLRLLRDEPGIECVGEARDGEEILEAARRLHPDLLFLDVSMPGLDGITALRRLDPRPLVVFTTAHEGHAVSAFDLQAVDYLLKPFGRARLQQALERVRQAGRPPTRTFEAEGPVRRLFVPERGRLVAVPLEDVERIEAEGDYLRLHAGGRTLLYHGSLKELEGRLDPERFVRVHRSHVVNLDHVARVEPVEGARLAVRLRSGSHVVASRRLTPRLRRRLCGPPSAALGRR